MAVKRVTKEKLDSTKKAAVETPVPETAKPSRAPRTHKPAARKPAVQVAVAPPAVPVVPSADELRAEIAQMAYHLWLERGCPDGHADQDWFRAEGLVLAKYR